MALDPAFTGNRRPSPPTEVSFVVNHPPATARRYLLGYVADRYGRVPNRNVISRLVFKQGDGSIEVRMQVHLPNQEVLFTASERYRVLAEGNRARVSITISVLPPTPGLEGESTALLRQREHELYRKLLYRAAHLALGQGTKKTAADFDRYIRKGLAGRILE